MRRFFDTNVFLYAVDPRDRDKQRRCAGHVDAAVAAGDAAISTQVLLEFFHNAVRRGLLGPPASREFSRRMAGNFEVIRPDVDDLFAAFDLTAKASISTWDALIVIAAAKAGCDQVLTEDLNPGQVVGGVRVVSPFAAG